MPLSTKVGLRPGQIVLHGDPAPSPSKKGATAPSFQPMFIVAKRLPIAEMGDRLATIGMGQKWELFCLLPWGCWSPSNTMLHGLRRIFVPVAFRFIQPFDHNTPSRTGQDRQHRQTTVRQDRANRFTNSRPKMSDFLPICGYISAKSRINK